MTPSWSPAPTSSNTGGQTRRPPSVRRGAVSQPGCISWKAIFQLISFPACQCPTGFHGTCGCVGVAISVSWQPSRLPLHKTLYGFKRVRIYIRFFFLFFLHPTELLCAFRQLIYSILCLSHRHSVRLCPFLLASCFEVPLMKGLL